MLNSFLMRLSVSKLQSMQNLHVISEHTVIWIWINSQVKCENAVHWLTNHMVHCRSTVKFCKWCGQEVFYSAALKGAEASVCYLSNTFLWEAVLDLDSTLD